jgi:hypothetical protein
VEGDEQRVTDIHSYIVRKGSNMRHSSLQELWIWTEQATMRICKLIAGSSEDFCRRITERIILAMAQTGDHFTGTSILSCVPALPPDAFRCLRHHEWRVAPSYQMPLSQRGHDARALQKTLWLVRLRNMEAEAKTKLSSCVAGVDGGREKTYDGTPGYSYYPMTSLRR